MPIAISSAMIPDIVVAFVSPGMAIISSPTEHTQVIASSFSMVSAAYSHLVFDIDGTLIDTVKIHMISLERTLKKYWGADAKLPDLRFPR